MSSTLKVRQPAPPRQAATDGAPAAEARGLFISYSHLDRHEVLELVQHLRPLAERARLDLFYDAQRIRAGDVWDDTLSHALKTCVLFVLVLSPNSLASSFCIQRELLCALERQRQGLCRIVPVLLRDCDWKGQLLPGSAHEFIAKFQALPRSERAVASRRGAARDSAWLEVVQGLAEVVAEPASAPAPRPAAAPAGSPLLPYLCDQRDPEDDVLGLLKRWREQPGPLVLVLRADVDDCPDKFIERIQERHLHKLLKRLPPARALQRHTGLLWPSASVALRGARDLEAHFMDQLIERVLNDPFASEDELLARLREDDDHRLFIGGLPTDPPALLQPGLQALGACLARLQQRLIASASTPTAAPAEGADLPPAAGAGAAPPPRLAVLLWTEDPQLKLSDPHPPWSSDGPVVCIGLPRPLGRFGIQALVDWSLLPEVSAVAQIDRGRLDEVFPPPVELSMRQFVAAARPLLQPPPIT